MLIGKSVLMVLIEMFGGAFTNLHVSLSRSACRHFVDGVGI